MINNKKKFTTAIVLLTLMIVLAIPFPDRWPLAETLFLAVGLPTRLAGGIQIPSFVLLAIFVIGISLLANSLERLKGRWIVLAIFVVFLAPSVLTGMVQDLFAKGVYAISYDREASSCHFEMKDETTLYGRCAVSLQNHSGTPVQFLVEFPEDQRFPDAVPMTSLMNLDGPLKAELQGKEKSKVVLEKFIDVTNVASYTENGEAMGMDIEITSRGKSREL